MPLPGSDASPRPVECMCFKAFGAPGCYRGHGFCPFLDPGGERGDWRDRLRTQIQFYRQHEPRMLDEARAKRREWSMR